MTPVVTGPFTLDTVRRNCILPVDAATQQSRPGKGLSPLGKFILQ
jgi:hypothetical protein